MLLVAGSMRVPKPAAGMTALRIFWLIVFPETLSEVPEKAGCAAESGQ